MIAYYLTHPQVEIDPDRPVPLWRLSALGRERLRAILGRPWLDGIERKLELPEMFDGDVYRSDMPRVPSTLHRATDLSGGDKAWKPRAFRSRPVPSV
jgi:hypothetical protein